jgi:hypothetical protein
MGNNKPEKLAFYQAIDDVVTQFVNRSDWVVDFRQSNSDPCLQVVDYCAWAIQRKWEHGDVRSYNLISKRITYEFDLWKHGTTHYY